MKTDITRCAICLDVLTRPKCLPCLHSFCLHCLQKCSVTYEERNKVLPCPTCRKPCQIPEDGVEGLINDFRMIEVIEMMDGMTKHVNQQEELDNLMPQLTERIRVLSKIHKDCDASNTYLESSMLEEQERIQKKRQMLHEAVDEKASRLLRSLEEHTKSGRDQVKQCQVHVQEDLAVCVSLKEYAKELATKDGRGKAKVISQLKQILGSKPKNTFVLGATAMFVAEPFKAPSFGDLKFKPAPVFGDITDVSDKKEVKGKDFDADITASSRPQFRSQLSLHSDMPSNKLEMGEVIFDDEISPSEVVERSSRSRADSGFVDDMNGFTVEPSAPLDEHMPPTLQRQPSSILESIPDEFDNGVFACPAPYDHMESHPEPSAPMEEDIAEITPDTETRGKRPPKEGATGNNRKQNVAAKPKAKGLGLKMTAGHPSQSQSKSDTEIPKSPEFDVGLYMLEQRKKRKQQNLARGAVFFSAFFGNHGNSR